MQARVSFGLPVYNGAGDLPKTIESVLSQTFSELELVVSDNASTDETPEVVRRYQEQDARVRYHRNPTNLGIRGNFNRVFEVAQAPFFRWIGVADWVEPTYAERCVAALEAVPEAVAVTTEVVFWGEDGSRNFLEYRGPRVESSEPARRFKSALTLMADDYRYFDPMYALYRRSALERTQLERLTLYADFALASEVSLLGPFTHVPELLSHRSRPLHSSGAWIHKMAPAGHPPLPYPPLDLFRHHVQMIRDTELPLAKKAACLGASANFCTLYAYRRSIEPLRGKLSTSLRKMGVPLDAIKRSLGLPGDGPR